MRTSGMRGVLFAGVAALALLKCGSDEDAAPPDRSEAGCGTTDFSICGYAFDDVSDELGRPAYTSPFASALARWDSEAMCQGAAARGRCEDGKDFLYWQLGDITEVRYYDEEGRPIAVALMRAESTCGDPCPRESFYGSLEDVRCDNPAVGPICGAVGNLETSDLPFAAGTPLVACEECAP
jgi:hypothetical protein